MSIVRSVSGAVAAVALALVPVVVSASDQGTAPKSSTVSTQVSASQFAALKGVKAAPMSSTELKTVKGQHVHFITLSNGKLHLAGDIKTENNWSNAWGGSDGEPVAPSYHGLCKAHGNGSIFIPTGPPGSGAPVTLQCPAGS